MINFHKKRSSGPDINMLLLGMIAHDIKAPLNQLAVYLETLKADDLNETCRDIVGVLNAHINSSGALLDTMLGWVNLQLTQKLPQVSQSVLLKLQADLIIISVKQLFIDNESVIENRIDHNMRVKLNLPVFEFVLRNLLFNAIKFNKPPVRVEVSASCHKKTIRICVSDNGIGMSAHEIEQLFNSINKQKNGMGKGAGLGLLLCHNCLQQYDGKIWAESNDQQGSSFYFMLPLGS
ncbi:sensor histidine kinase [Pedobacter sp. BS3]|uniref:sensor histidine kinase n=1 Tax=Pedobacter sp. BS3 TaxID=2567937 RepID=UPI001659AC94|nr:HAMP domain-containing sensor histidine kinase [Pedobacter sp. BS3]